MQLLVENCLRALLNVLDDGVHILSMDDRRDLEQYAGFRRLSRTRNTPRNVVQTFRMPEEARSRPVRRRVVAFRHRKRRFLEASLRNREQSRQSERRGPASSPRIEEDFFVGGKGSELIEDVFE